MTDRESVMDDIARDLLVDELALRNLMRDHLESIGLGDLIVRSGAHVR